VVHPVPGGYKYGDLALQGWGVSKIGTIKCGLESRGIQTLAGLRWRVPAATLYYSPVLSSERVLQNNKLQLSKENFKEKEKLVAVADGYLTPRRTGRLTVGRNVTFTSTSNECRIARSCFHIAVKLEYLSVFR
jgi:hypothetical protein